MERMRARVDELESQLFHLTMHARHLREAAQINEERAQVAESMATSLQCYNVTMTQGIREQTQRAESAEAKIALLERRLETLQGASRALQERERAARHVVEERDAALAVQRKRVVELEERCDLLEFAMSEFAKMDSKAPRT